MLTEHTKRQVCLYRKIQKSIIFITALCFKVTYSMPLFLYCSRHVTHTSREVFCLLNKTKGNFFCERQRHRSSDGLDTSLQTSTNNDKYSRFFSFIHFARGKPLLRSWTGRREHWNINRRRFWFSQYVCYLRVLSMWYIPLRFLHLLLRVLLSTR